MCIIYKIKESFHPSYQYIVCFERLPFRSIYIAKTKVALSRLDLNNKIKTLFALLFLPAHLLIHFKTDTGNYTFAPRICVVIVFMSTNECVWLTHCVFPECQ